MSLSTLIYLDYQATTPCDERVLSRMLPYFTKVYGNPHSRSHSFGWEAEEGVEKARKQIADSLGADPREIIFTSGATEANNMALKGVAHFYKEKRHIITSQIEHKCVLASCRQLEREGWKITTLPVGKTGRVNIKELEAAFTQDTLLVSIMAVNNEIGVIQPIEEIGALCRARGVFFHTDAAQAIGKIPLQVKDMKIDLLSLSGHKIYGPKGIGALYVSRSPRVRMEALIHGGDQERGFRSGTLPVPLCVGLGEACFLSQKEMVVENKRLEELRTHFLTKVFRELPDVTLNGDPIHRIPGNINLSFSYVEGEGLMMGIKDLALSSGSACTSESLESSYVLRALGVEDDIAPTSIRIGFGRYTTFEEVDYAANSIIRVVTKLREMSPLWEMAEAGIDLRAVKWGGHH